MAHVLRASACAALLSLLAITTTLRGQAPATVPASYLDALPFRAIGPALAGGRIGDLAVNEANPAMFYVAAATGGLWKTGELNPLEQLAWPQLLRDATVPVPEAPPALRVEPLADTGR